MVQPALFDGGPDGTLSQEQAEQLMRPFAEKFIRIWHDAWNDWLELPEESRAKFTSRTRSNIVSDFAVSYAKEAFRGDAGFEICNELKFFKVYLGEEVVFRLKRVGRQTLLASNIRTKQQKAWYSHKPVNGVKGKRTRLVVGYTLDSTELKIERVVVTLQWALDKLSYFFILDDGASAPPLPQIPLSPIPSDKKPVVRPKAKPPEEE